MSLANGVMGFDVPENELGDNWKGNEFIRAGVCAGTKVQGFLRVSEAFRPPAVLHLQTGRIHPLSRRPSQYARVQSKEAPPHAGEPLRN
jgi:hypothetical protein